MKEIAAILNLLDAHPGAPAVLATLVRVDGSSYRRPGARLLCLPDGTRAGSISGGCLEEDLIERARRVLATGRAARAGHEAGVFERDHDFGQVCGRGLEPDSNLAGAGNGLGPGGDYGQCVQAEVRRFGNPEGSGAILTSRISHFGIRIPK